MGPVQSLMQRTEEGWLTRSRASERAILMMILMISHHHGWQILQWTDHVDYSIEWWYNYRWDGNTRMVEWEEAITKVGRI